MASKNTAFLALFLSLNLLFFSMVSGCSSCPKPKPKPKPKPCPPPPSTPTPTPSTPPVTPTPTPSTPPFTPTPTPSTGKCPVDALKLGVCANLLGGLLGAIIGTPPSKPCCTLIQGLADLEAAVCLCTAIKANILGINLNIPVSLSLLLSACKKDIPSGFKCA